MTTPVLRLMEVSGWSCPPPRATATAEVDGTTPLFVNCPPMNAVVTLNACCCPGVGARNPLLTAPRTETTSVSPTRAESLPFVVVPKSSKYSDRMAVPTVHWPPGSLNSTSP